MTNRLAFSKTFSPRAVSAAFLFLFVAGVSTMPGFAATRYKIGSQNTVTADRLVPRPSTTPCVVQLFANVAFDDFNPRTFTYTPPANCPGPWEKVVFEGDFSVSAGIQYDRTANIWLGATNIYFGTTAEPSPNFGPSWHVETDLTDYSSIFGTAQSGQADIGNLVNSTYTGIIYGTATLEFYPLTAKQKAPQTFRYGVGAFRGAGWRNGRAGIFHGHSGGDFHFADEH